MIEGEPNDDIAVRIGRPIAQQARLGRPGGTEVGLPARGGRDGAGSNLAAQPGNVQAHSPNQAPSEQRKPRYRNKPAMESRCFDRGAGGAPYHLAEITERDCIRLLESQRQQTQIAEDRPLLGDDEGTLSVFVQMRPWQRDVGSTQFGYFGRYDREALAEYRDPRRTCWKYAAGGNQIAERHLTRHGNSRHAGSGPHEIRDHAPRNGQPNGAAIWWRLLAHEVTRSRRTSWTCSASQVNRSNSGQGAASPLLYFA